MCLYFIWLNFKQTEITQESWWGLLKFDYLTDFSRAQTENVCEICRERDHTSNSNLAVCDV